MKVWQETFKLVLPKSHGRSAGYHISEVIRDLALHGKVLDAKWVKDIVIEEQNTNMMQLGLAFEDYLGTFQHPEVQFHPGELSRFMDVCLYCGHNVEAHKNARHEFRPVMMYLSPDGLSVLDPEDFHETYTMIADCLHEFKFTKKSSRDFADSLRYREKKVKMWLWQIMAYAYVIGTVFAKLHVMFVNGNYSRDDSDPESMPTYKIFRLLFEQEEVDDNWLMLELHTGHMIRNGKFRVV